MDLVIGNIIYTILGNRPRGKIYNTHLMHLSATRGIIALFVKLGKDALFLGNWRPLTLLNCDYKIYAKILAIRLNTVLPKLIHPMQTGFINNRNIAENIFSLIKVIDHCNKEKTPAFGCRGLK